MAVGQVEPGAAEAVERRRMLRQKAGMAQEQRRGLVQERRQARERSSWRFIIMAG